MYPAISVPRLWNDRPSIMIVELHVKLHDLEGSTAFLTLLLEYSVRAHLPVTKYCCTLAARLVEYFDRVRQFLSFVISLLKPLR